MPNSSQEGKGQILSWLWELAPQSVLDVGPGRGTYAYLISALPKKPRLTAIEVFEPYVDKYSLTVLYDEIIVGDVRVTQLPEVEVVILGDVLEHMDEFDALCVWSASLKAATKAVILSIPIVHSPQGVHEGNEHERHIVDDWNYERVLGTFPGVTDSWRGEQIGVYLAKKS